MAISKTRILDNLVAALTAADLYVDGAGEALEGDDLAAAQNATRVGAAYLVDAIIDEVIANAEVSVTVATTVTGTAATDGIGFETYPITETADGEVLDDAAVSGTGAGTGTGGIS